MKNEIPVRAIAFAALAIAVASALFSWRYSSAYSTAVKNNQRQIQGLHMKHDELEHHMICIQTLLLRYAKKPSLEPQQPDAFVPQALEDSDGGSIWTLEEVEAVTIDRLSPLSLTRYAP